MTFRRHFGQWLALLAITLPGVAAGLGCAASRQSPHPPPVPVMPARTSLIRSVVAPSASVPLLWDASPDTVAGYAMYWGVVDSGATNRMDVGVPLQVTVSNLTVGADYWFFVTAYDTNATESLPSNTLLYTPPAPPAPAQVFAYSIQHYLTNNVWTNYITVLATNPPQGMFRVAMSLTNTP